MRREYSIDALRNKDGSYQRATSNVIKGALTCGHTAHLQTERGTVAFRPYKIKEVRINKRTGEQYFPGEAPGKNWLVEFYPPNHTNGDEVKLYTNNLIDAIRFAYGHLNGEIGASITVNERHDVHSNQATREGYVLAVLGEQVLIEYEMPGTTCYQRTSALRIVNMIGREQYGKYKSHSYTSIPKKWVTAMHDQGTTCWLGMGQRMSEPQPFPSK